MPPEWLPLIAAGNERFAAALGAVAVEDWRRPSNCEDWQVLDIPAHLAFGASYYIQAIEHALASDVTPLWTDGMDGVHARHGALRRGTPAEGLALFQDTAARLDEAYARIGPDDLDRLAWHILAPRPLWRYLAMRVYELTLHEWDLRTSLGQAATLPSPPLPALSDLLLGTLLPLTLDRAAAEGLDATFAFDFGGGLSTCLRISVSVAAIAELSDADVRITMTREQFVLALSGRVPWPAGAEIEGDKGLGQRFRELFKPL